MNDFWLAKITAETRTQDIRREMANIRLAQSVNPTKRRSLQLGRLLSIVKPRPGQNEKGETHGSADYSILAVD